MSAMAEVHVDLHCPACGHQVFTILEDGFHCARCGHEAQPYCELGKASSGEDSKSSFYWRAKLLTPRLWALVRRRPVDQTAHSQIRRWVAFTPNEGGLCRST